MSAVYFIQTDESRNIKIGCTEGCVAGRVKTLQTGHWETLKLLRFIPTDSPRYIESKWHRRFREDRIRGEWFRPGDDLVAAIDVLPVLDVPKRRQAQGDKSANPFFVYRAKEGLRLIDAAQRMGISVTYYSDLERGLAQMSAEKALHVSKLVGIPALTLLGLEKAS